MKASYNELKKRVNRSGFGPECHDAVENMLATAREVLMRCDRLPLVSKVRNKTYFSFSAGNGFVSRAINAGVFCEKMEDASAIFMDVLRGNRHAYSSSEITAAIYTASISACAAIDVVTRSDRKTQGTLFEWICAALMQATLHVIPTRSLEVLNLDLEGKLPTDFIFDLGIERPKFHLPVKTSTRERVIQVWAHQRVLDGVYGTGRFLAMPIVLTETKVETKTSVVTEICLPWQWRLYQMHIAQLWHVCYLDMPEDYLKLNDVFPPVRVVTVGDLLAKDGPIDALLMSHGL